MQNQQFNNVTILLNGINISKKYIKCNLCKKIFKSKQKYSDHYKYCKLYRCIFCIKKFTKLRYLKYHMLYICTKIINYNNNDVTTDNSESLDITDIDNKLEAYNTKENNTKENNTKENNTNESFPFYLFDNINEIIDFNYYQLENKDKDLVDIQNNYHIQNIIKYKMCEIIEESIIDPDIYWTL